MYELLTGLGLALPAGLNAYIPLLIVALSDRYFGLIQLSPPYDMISSPVGILVILILLVVELLADKIPVVDHVNDLINSVVRPTAGAILVMGSTDMVDFMNPILAMVLGLLAAGSVHAVKAALRPTITVTTGGLGNPIVSAAEDGAAIGLSILALLAPVVIILILIAQVFLFTRLIRRRRKRRVQRPAAPPQ